MPAYKVYDENGRVISQIASVLAPVALTGVTTTTNNILTVTSTAGLFPGMAVSAANVPLGSFIHSIISDTEIELWKSTWNLTTGAWSTTGANANASAGGPADGPAYAYGFDPLCLVALAYAQGTWRNTIRSSLSGGLVHTNTYVNETPHSVNYPGLLTSVVTDTAGYIAGWSTTPAGTILSDEATATPLKRHNGELWGVYTFVSTGGLKTLIRANPSYNIVLSSAT